MRPLLVVRSKFSWICKRFFHPESAIKELQKFDAKLPVEAAKTPPSSWFNSELFHVLDKVNFY